MEKLVNRIFPFFKGRVALYAILKALNITPGDDVILPGFTCVVVPNAIKYLGANPVYIDIDPETYNIDPNKIEQKLSNNTKAIIAQHTFGIPVDMDKVLDIAKKYNLYVIEDSCHAMGSRYKGQEVGTFGDAAFFSSQWSKPITTGLGGWAIINNHELKTNMQNIYSEFVVPSNKEQFILRLQYLIYSKFFKPSLFWSAMNAYRKLSGLGMLIGSSTREELQCVMPEGYKKRMPERQKDLLLKKIQEVGKSVQHRRRIASVYKDLLSNKGLETVKLSNDYDPVFLRYPVMVNNKRRVLEKARKKKIEIGDWFLSPVHPNLGGWEKAGYEKGMCPNAETTCEHIINLAIHSRIDVKEAQKIVEFLASI